MSASFFGVGFTFLIALPVLIAQWVGVVALRRSGRDGAWWCMLLGTMLSSLGVLASAVFTILLVSRVSGMGGGGGSAMETMMMVGVALGGVSSLGSVLFMIGFAIHGLKSGRQAERIAELELVLSAQQEELARAERGG